MSQQDKVTGVSEMPVFFIYWRQFINIISNTSTAGGAANQWGIDMVE